jgi:histidinol-phosphate phosphatase family protein
MEKEYMAVIQAGGKGTRMVELTEDRIPKPMLTLNGKPMIQWQIENLAEHGINDICIITGHLGEVIEDYFGDGSRYGISITYIREKEPLGSAGALYYVKEIARQRNVVLVFGDVMVKIDWKRMIGFHKEKGALATLLVHPNSHPYDSDLVIMDRSCRITGIDSKSNVRDYWYENLVNAGIYVLDNELLNQFEKAECKDLEKDVLVPLMGLGRIYGYKTPEYVKDAGTPQRFCNCCKEQENGIWDAKCLDRKQRAVFLDRDGTINRYNGLISREEQLELEVNAAEAIRYINSSGYLAICVTNQPVVARGMCRIEDVEGIHRKLQSLLGNEGAYLDDIVFCPHHPDKGYSEENPLYKIKCNCRKPLTGMIEKMAERYNIDLSQSYMVGDSTTDIQTGINAGLHTVLVRTGQGGSDEKYAVKADAVADNLFAAVKEILN